MENWCFSLWESKKHFLETHSIMNHVKDFPITCREMFLVLQNNNFVRSFRITEAWRELHRIDENRLKSGGKLVGERVRMWYWFGHRTYKNVLSWNTENVLMHLQLRHIFFLLINEQGREKVSKFFIFKLKSKNALKKVKALPIAILHEFKLIGSDSMQEVLHVTFQTLTEQKKKRCKQQRGD